jgi:hypothetical protein
MSFGFGEERPTGQQDGSGYGCGGHAHPFQERASPHNAVKLFVNVLCQRQRTWFRRQGERSDLRFHAFLSILLIMLRRDSNQWI